LQLGFTAGSSVAFNTVTFDIKISIQIQGKYARLPEFPILHLGCEQGSHRRLGSRLGPGGEKDQIKTAAGGRHKVVVFLLSKPRGIVSHKKSLAAVWCSVLNFLLLSSIVLKQQLCLKRFFPISFRPMGLSLMR